MIKGRKLLWAISSMMLLSACTPTEAVTEEIMASSSIKSSVEVASVATAKQESKEFSPESAVSSEYSESTEPQSSVSHDGYALIEVDGGNISGYRAANVVVDIGFGDREYWAYTNEYGQLVRVVAAEIILQDNATEPVNSDGRYYDDEAKVPGTENENLDEGHVIADSLGGVANAYNITPQDSVLNRHGDQAYMERTIQQAGGATNFEAIITYPNTTTHVPSYYRYTYTINGYQVVDEFENINPDEYNAAQGLTGEGSSPSDGSGTAAFAAPTDAAGGDVSAVDMNGNEQVTIQEAKNAGYAMPIYSNHGLYQFMDDRDGDGQVGE
ncbi:DNA/RNA non-specific endonuclease [Trichococcus collinsii]|uniref:DNA/RNA non-specific endonuclease n=1 Tax=Trichococcus collinsii TaxID=157076 RepID=A0AB37ZXX5_9LACT|nr:DNA/RNA non-specific endonuclease [Trichococcus collinsii]CZQ80486.1 dna/rna non-specific endonuclease [Trichococcus collinsii]SDZ92604.1 DNA/RNA non-specific endonuclease [Trichococcus collinsii]